MLPPRDPATGRFLARPSEPPHVQALLDRYEEELGDVPAALAKADVDGVSVLARAAVILVVVLILLVVVAVNLGNAL